MRLVESIIRGIVKLKAPLGVITVIIGFSDVAPKVIT